MHEYMIKLSESEVELVCRALGFHREEQEKHAKDLEKPPIDLACYRLAQALRDAAEATARLIDKIDEQAEAEYERYLLAAALED